MTGSHNLGTKASRVNDDRLVIIEGSGAHALAIAYAVNIIAIHQEYRRRSYVATHKADAMTAKQRFEFDLRPLICAFPAFCVVGDWSCV